ncbi:MAG: LuxR C-terminal-related transcriptional regulator [Hydrococcus sp. Prado102]|jgi:DNA-binding CsgD family transcriptional regulator|nr:LuxR C-terminal-related transcriptional regulator [Hydrococcus sp. Prado102]
MVQTLHSLVSSLAIAQNESELRSRFMDSARELFEANTWGWKSLNDRYEIVDCELQGVSNTILKRYQEVGCDRDPLMRFAIEHHTPVDEQLIFTSEQWQRSLIYQHVFSRYQIEHIAIAPIIGNGRLLGKIYVARNKDSTPFTTHDLSKLGALSTHLSVCLAALRSRQQAIESPFVQYLTKREQQIANLIARGLKTPELSDKLGITQNSVKQALKRIFVKLNVSTRAEMVAKLRTIPYR